MSQYFTIQTNLAVISNNKWRNIYKYGYMKQLKMYGISITCSKSCSQKISICQILSMGCIYNVWIKKSNIVHFSFICHFVNYRVLTLLAVLRSSSIGYTAIGIGSKNGTQFNIADLLRHHYLYMGEYALLAVRPFYLL